MNAITLAATVSCFEAHDAETVLLVTQWLALFVSLAILGYCVSEYRLRSYLPDIGGKPIPSLRHRASDRSNKKPRRYLSSGLMNLNVNPATKPPAKSATR